MSLNWRTADVTLTEDLVPSPGAEHNLLRRLLNVRVAIEGGFLHVDARPNGEPAHQGQTEFSVTVVPVTSVKTLAYKVQAPKSAAPIEVQVG